MRSVEKHYRGVVADGAAFLDERWPGWWKRVNSRTLNVESCLNCVLGQLFGSYQEGMDWVSDMTGHKFACRYGFATGTMGNYKLLTELWVEVLTQRRLAEERKHKEYVLVS